MNAERKEGTKQGGKLEVNLKNGKAEEHQMP